MRWAASKVQTGFLESFGGYPAREGEGGGRGRSDRWREELPLFSVAKGARKRGVPAVPEWLKRATGPGGPLEAKRGHLYFEELGDGAGVFSARVRSEAMREALVVGDVVVLRSAGKSGVKLGRDEGVGRANAVAQTRVDVPDDSVWVVQVNGSEPALVRVRYYAAGGEWHVMLQADNPVESGYPRIVTRQDEVTFWARVIGFAKEG